MSYSLCRMKATLKNILLPNNFSQLTSDKGTPKVLVNTQLRIATICAIFKPHWNYLTKGKRKTEMDSAGRCSKMMSGNCNLIYLV